MINDDLLDRLPSDPEDAFSILESEIRTLIPPYKEVGDQDEQRAYDNERAEFQKEYIITLAAFASVNNLDLDIDFTQLMSLEGYGFINKFDEASKKIQFFAKSCAFKLALKRKTGTTCVYVLDVAEKTRIRKAIETIKIIISKADLTDLKKEALLRKLNAFAHEVDKDRTNVEAFAALYVFAKREAKQVQELMDVSEKVWSYISKGKELYKLIPPIKVAGYLFEPQKKLEHENKDDLTLDDEIPF